MVKYFVFSFPRFISKNLQELNPDCRMNDMTNCNMVTHCIIILYFVFSV